jgi:hypothetical protein
MFRKGLPLALAVVVCLEAASSARAATAVGGVVLPHSLKLVKTSSSAAAASPSASAGASGPEIRMPLEQDREFDKQISGSMSPARVPAAHVPTPSTLAVQSGAAGGFDGLTHLEQRLADNGNQFSLEPPDQGLAVGSGYVVEAVNTAIRFRRTDGTALSGAISLNKFFGLPSAILRTNPPVFGPFMTDPKAYFDPVLQRFFVTALSIATDPATGAFLGHSSVFIAVSRGANPALGWYIYELDTTNDGTGGTPAHPGCPCFGDQPLIGADANGFYVSTNEFPIFVAGFHGAQVYAMSKSALARGATPPVVLISPGALEEGPSYSLQPATTPPGGSYEPANNGTQYFMSALEFTGGVDNRLALWALTGSASLNSRNPSVTLRYVIVDSQVYGQPPAMQQKDGPLPLADLIRAGAFGKPAQEHLPLVESNDDRMNQTVYAAGKLWCALNTVVKLQNGTVQTGIAWFIVSPSWSGAALSGSIANQGYVAVAGNSVAFPAVAVNSGGKGVIGFSLVGPDYYPSAAYVLIDSTGTSDVLIAKPGIAPDDGFTGYVTFGGRVGRWGDYSAAVADETGNIWFATEYIPGGDRTVLANWGSYIARVTP